MRYELRRRLEIVGRALATLGEHDNAAAIARRTHDGTLPDWIQGEHGAAVWSEIEGAAGVARRFSTHLPIALRAAAVALERAFREAEALMADEPKGGLAWREERAISTVAAPSAELRRAA